MTSASDLIKPGRHLIRKPGSATYHKFSGCTYAQREEMQMDAVKVTSEVLNTIESPFSHAKLCITCFGTDGHKTPDAASRARSPKVTVDTLPLPVDDETAITPDHPRKDHEMARTVTPPVTPEGEQASVAAIEQAAAQREAEWSLDTLEDSIEHTTWKQQPQPSFNAIEGTPEAVRRRAEVSLAHNTAALRKAQSSNAKRARIDYRWDLQPVPDADKGAEFAKALEKYATNRPSNVSIPHRQDGTPDGRVTARCGDPAQFVKTDHGYQAYKDGMAGEPFWAVRYSVRPFEQRGAGRKPDTAK